jgi:hypothetical protein
LRILSHVFWIAVSGLALALPFVLIHLAGTALSRMFGDGFQQFGPSPAEITLLAQDVHIVVGDVPLVFPLIALPEFSESDAFFTDDGADYAARMAAARSDFASSAASPAAAPHLDKVRIHVERFGWDDSAGARWETICAELVRDWARSVCDAHMPPLLQALPATFTLADAQNLKAFRDTFLSVGNLGEAAPLLQAMDLTTDEPALACGVPHKPEAPYPCLVAQRLSGDLIAVWFVSDGPDEPALTTAHREGKAIAALVAYGLGPVEDFSRLISSACATLRPGAGPSSTAFAPPWPC